ncbi:hypothetical protein BHM03_00006837 [Ensete ventricosum]|nr:hypothetical protein BHM03_00006837 [Ensete ventricosum]
MLCSVRYSIGVPNGMPERTAWSDEKSSMHLLLAWVRRSRQRFPHFLVALDEEKVTRRRPRQRSRHLVRFSSTVPSRGSPAVDVSDNRATASPLEGSTIRGSPSFSCFFLPRSNRLIQPCVERYRAKTMVPPDSRWSAYQSADGPGRYVPPIPSGTIRNYIP